MKMLLMKILAKIRGTFLTDCPRCHRYFYGYHDYVTHVKFERNYRIVCHFCAEEHVKLNKELLKIG